MSFSTGALRLRLLAAIIAVAATAVIVPQPARAAVTLQPGARVRTTAGSCTLNFVYDGTGAYAGKVYLGTAAHCVDKVGESVRDDDGITWGKVAFIGPWRSTATDYAFIEVASDHVGRVSAAMKGHPQYPKGVAVDEETVTGDQVQFSGYGIGFNATQTTRESRVGILTFDDSGVQRVYGTVTFGDSGGPVVHVPTGKALGIATEICVASAVCTERGPTIDGVVNDAATAGFTVTLRTV